MKVGDIVRYDDWYIGNEGVGLIIEQAKYPSAGEFFLVHWVSDNRLEWEESIEIEVINELV
tara:strand:- start:521 stop:703 length:183 start_codon:yes stop_codon:yes gene_type:complete